MKTTAMAAVLTGAVWGAFCVSGVAGEKAPARKLTAGENFSPGRLVAWCIVPFDAKKRGPGERAEMLKRLGIGRLAYDWRARHVPGFEREIVAARAHGIEFFAFWGEHERMFELLAKHKITPQVWKTLGSPKGGTQAQRVEAAGRAMLPLVARTRKLGCKLGLYNHGGWGGEPDNLVAVCKWLRANAGTDHVGIVYNLHHGHGHIADFAKVLAAMKPYLLCLNLNGMNDRARPKILPVGRGTRDKEMIRIILESGYDGPVGIIGHDASVDVEQRLKANLDGLADILAELTGKPATGQASTKPAAAETREVRLTAADVRNVKGDGPDGKGNTDDDTLDAKDHGIVLRYGDGPDRCDMLGARDVWVFRSDGVYYMHYDAAGPKGWLCALAVSKDLLTWAKKGPVLDFGKGGEDDSKSASYGTVYHDGKQWHMFYLGTPNVTPPPNLVPSFPYLTMKAKAAGPAGPWIKQRDVVPFRPKAGTYYSLIASPGQVVKSGQEYLQFFSATTRKPGNPCVQRTLGIARTKNLDGPWSVDSRPVVPIEEQIENSSLYYENSIKTWFLFTNHVGTGRGEYTDAIWVYWSRDLNKWDPKDKAVVLDGRNCTWSNKCIGLPSVLRVGKRLALFYDAPGGDSISHMRRHVGLAWLDLPLSAPKKGE